MAADSAVIGIEVVVAANETRTKATELAEEAQGLTAEAAKRLVADHGLLNSFTCRISGFISSWADRTDVPVFEPPAGVEA